MLKAIGGEIISQELNDNFSYLESEKMGKTELPFVNIMDYGAVGDGVINDTAAFNAAQDALVAQGGGVLKLPARTFLLDAITVKKGVYIEGAGMSLIFDYVNGIKTGTVLLINGQVGQDCLSFELEKNVMGMRNLSVYNNTANGINSVVRIKGNSFVQLRDVEISGTKVCDGAGLYVDPYIGTRTNGAHYNYFFNVSVVGSYMKYGIFFKGYPEYEGANSNVFYGGRVNGWFKSLVLTGSSSTNGSVNNLVFNDITFEHVFNANSPISHISDTKDILGYNTSVYGVKFIDVSAGKQNLFKGCRIEHGNTPTSYNDGTNGSKQVIGLVNLSNPTVTRHNQFIGNAVFNVYYSDQGYRTIVNSEKSGLNILPSTKPALLLEKTADASIPHATATTINFESVDNNEINYSSGVVTFKQDGIYQINAQILFSSFVNAKRANVVIHKNGADFFLVGNYGVPIANGASYRVTSSISTMIRAAKGDTIKIMAYHEAGSAQPLAGFRDSTWCQIYKL
jgi:hypothetical protein